jgi:hypothetical protein
MSARIAEGTVAGMVHLKAVSLGTEAEGIASRITTSQLPQGTMP